MTTPALWATLAAIGLVTFAWRFSFVALWQRLAIPEIVERALVYVPAAVLAAIVAPELIAPDGGIALSLGNERLLAGITAGLVAWRTQNMVATIGVGMIALWLLQVLV
ncbi:MAG: AzlD domain-containing protein [Candidatus Bipolaricaulia bacterium]